MAKKQWGGIEALTENSDEIHIKKALQYHKCGIKCTQMTFEEAD